MALNPVENFTIISLNESVPFKDYVYPESKGCNCKEIKVTYKSEFDLFEVNKLRKSCLYSLNKQGTINWE